MAIIEGGVVIPGALHRVPADGVQDAQVSDEFKGADNGLGVRRTARFEFNPSANTGERTVGAHGLGVTIPAKAIIVGGVIDVITTFASAGADAGTIAVSVEGANDIVSAIAISDGTNPWDADIRAIVPKNNTPETTGIKLATTAKEVTATVAGQALTAGKFVGFLDYYISE